VLIDRVKQSSVKFLHKFIFSIWLWKRFWIMARLCTFLTILPL